MGGLLQAYGQSTAGQTFADVTKNMVGVAKAGMEMEQQGLENQYRQAGVDIAKAQETRAQAEFDQKQKIATRRLPLTLRWGPMETWSNSRKAIVEEGRKMGLVEDVGGIPTASPNDYKTFIESVDPSKAVEFSAMNLSEHAADMGEIQKKLAANPEDPKLIAERDRIIGLYTTQKTGHDTLVDAIAAKKRAEEEGKGSNVKGFNPDTKKAVIEDAKGNLWEEGTPYQGGPLLPTTTAAGSPSWHIVPDKSSGSGYRYEDLNTGKKGSEAPAPRLNQEDKSLTPAQRATMTLQTRKEFNSNPIVRQYYETKGQVEKMEQAVKESATAKTKVAVDQALITVFNKMMDPTSVVRESEYARTPSDQALVNRIKGKWNKVLEGGAGLTDVERDGIIRMGRNFGKVNKAMYDDHAEYYKSIASGTGLNPDHVVRPDKFNEATRGLTGDGPTTIRYDAQGNRVQ